ncbi:DUF4245 domain-containing protein [Nocardioides sp.]|uniref:DUF4245 domain-containing protein n=1 Tax=Nocardioides sp. TaxID=35761 RepID=UPI0031FEB51D|nr:hypothetical protein [Nocardioides sp.]
MSESGNAGRYARTTNGLIASLVVTVLAVGGFVGLRALTRDDLEVKPDHVDYLAAVDGAQSAGLTVVYPPSLPRGWIADSISFERGDPPAWGIGMLTASGKFAGIRQEDASVTDLLHTYVDDNPTEGDPVEVAGSVARTWQTWSDSGGDHAFSAEVGHDTVLVFGSASVADLRELLDRLTVAKH